MVVLFQVACVIALLMFVVVCYCLVGKDEEEQINEVDGWLMKVERVGRAEKSLRPLFWELSGMRRYDQTIELSNGIYRIGNRFGVNNDIFLNFGTKAQVLVNLQKKNLELSVIKGTVRVQGYTYKKDSKKKLILEPYDEIIIGSLKLVFRKKEGETHVNLV